jgi:hypothetical protein
MESLVGQAALPNADLGGCGSAIEYLSAVLESGGLIADKLIALFQPLFQVSDGFQMSPAAKD